MAADPSDGIDLYADVDEFAQVYVTVGAQKDGFICKELTKKVIQSKNLTTLQNPICISVNLPATLFFLFFLEISKFSADFAVLASACVLSLFNSNCCACYIARLLAASLTSC